MMWKLRAACLAWWCVLASATAFANGYPDGAVPTEAFDETSLVLQGEDWRVEKYEAEKEYDTEWVARVIVRGKEPQVFSGGAAYPEWVRFHVWPHIDSPELLFIAFYTGGSSGHVPLVAVDLLQQGKVVFNKDHFSFSYLLDLDDDRIPELIGWSGRFLMYDYPLPFGGVNSPAPKLVYALHASRGWYHTVNYRFPEFFEASLKKQDREFRGIWPTDARMPAEVLLDKNERESEALILLINLAVQTAYAHGLEAGQRLITQYCDPVLAKVTNHFLRMEWQGDPNINSMDYNREAGFRIQLDTVTEGFDGASCWFHPRAASIPAAEPDQPPTVLLTMQKWFLSASDYFSGLSFLETEDLGKTWSEPVAPEALAWREEADGVIVGGSDFTPQWHAPTGKVLGIGHTVRYKDGKLLGDPRPRETSYAVYDPETREWTPWRMLEMPDDPRFFSAGAGSVQWLVQEDGTLLVPIYFKPRTEGQQLPYTATVLHCSFDGETLRYLSHGTELSVEPMRGLGEPSLTKYRGKYYLTLRNDEQGYVTSGWDGLNFDPVQPWRFDDDEPLGNYNTQQHWVTHSEGLFLVYTRRGAENDHIMRHRAPLFIAEVDHKRLRVIRSRERVLIPEVGATYGNFGVVNVSPAKTWVTDAEGMHAVAQAVARGANARVYAARLLWDVPNRLALSR